MGLELGDALKYNDKIEQKETFTQTNTAGEWSGMIK